ncbi:peptidoglycan-binding protein [Candidatus Kaiserbacteria bacterium]|nr:peptidoglycan-binding protein [Candidatus Kaiserbacteria bacterium]
MNTALRSTALSTLLSVAFISTPFIAAAQTTGDLNVQIQGISTQLQTLLQQVRTIASSASTSTTQTSDISSLSAKIDALKQQIQAMVASIKTNLPNPGQFPTWNASSTAPHMERGCGAFMRNLSHGSQGNDVIDLQQILSDNGLLDADSHTGFFGPRTAEALAKFQERFMGVASSSRGSFGPMTREFIRQHYCANIPTQAGNPASTGDRPNPVNWKLPSTTWPTWNYPTTTWDRPTSTWPTTWNASSSNAWRQQAILAEKLERGMSGENVKKLQEILASRHDGVFTDEHVTGFFGPKTEEAVKRFQDNSGINPLGIVGPQTLEKINELLKNSGMTNGADNTTLLQAVIDRVHEIQRQIPALTSSTSTFDISRLKDLLGEIRALHQQIPAAAQDIVSDANPDNASLWRCMPRPACLDATPRCMLPEPAEGWCSPSDTPSPNSCGQIRCLVYQPVCGSDGQTYSCGTADAHACGVQVVHSGECQNNSNSNVVGAGQHCGGFINNTPVCASGLRCQLSNIPDTGGTCVTDSTNPPVACTADAMMCPDGSYVGRTGPNCTFACSGTNSDTTSTNPSVPYNACAALTRDLSIGAQGTDVSLLQRLLYSKGLISSSSLTGYFGDLTKNALTQYQSSHGIDAAGVLGPATRAFISAHCAEFTNSGGTQTGSSDTNPSGWTGSSTTGNSANPPITNDTNSGN